MGCNCGGKKKPQFEVVTPNGKVVFRSGNEVTANEVAKRYPEGTEVRPSKPRQTT